MKFKFKTSSKTSIKNKFKKLKVGRRVERLETQKIIFRQIAREGL